MLRQTLFMSLVTAGLLTALQATDGLGEAVHQPQTQAEPAKAVHELQIVAGRFSYEPATLQVIAGESVRLVIRSKDTVHGFSIPKLHIDKQIPKGGESIVIDFIAPPPGRFDIECSEFCGSGHKQMKAVLISVAPTVTNQ
jgi:cytochrome c oxidase subunit 2